MGPGSKARERGGGGGSPGVPASASSRGTGWAAEHSLFSLWAELLLDVMLN